MPVYILNLALSKFQCERPPNSLGGGDAFLPLALFPSPAYAPQSLSRSRSHACGPLRPRPPVGQCRSVGEEKAGRPAGSPKAQERALQL